MFRRLKRWLECKLETPEQRAERERNEQALARILEEMRTEAVSFEIKQERA